MMIDVGDFVLLKYGDMEILKAVLTSHEKMLQNSGTSGAVQISEESPVGRAMILFPRWCYSI